MANERISSEHKEYAVIDTNPEAGYFTKELDFSDLKLNRNIREVNFSVRQFSEATPVITPVLQFMCEDDLYWQDYVPFDGSSFAIGNRLALKCSSVATKWRAGVKAGGYTSGAIILGFDW